MKNKKKKNRTNREIIAVTSFFVLVFACFVGYFIYFMNVESEAYITSPYNTRQDLLARKVIRGEILSSDGTVLAETVTDDAGEEVRRYPYSSLFAHVLGYSSRGKSGLESAFNFYMLKSHQNPFDQIVNELSGRKNSGDQVVTTLDLALQKAAYDGLGEFNGAVVAIEPKTGRILSMVSKPDFDPNGIDEAWDSLVSEDGSSNLLNRATAGMYPPGSTFKIVTALEYYRERGAAAMDDFFYDCVGGYTLGDYFLECYEGSIHGAQTLRLAFANSCNAAFAEMGLTLDMDRYHTTAEELLYNQEMPFVLSGKSGSFSLNAESDDWEVIQTAIGQGKTLVTPLQNALLAACVANGGTMMKPYVVDRIQTASGGTVKAYQPSEYSQPLTAEEAAFLTELMKAVVEEGTASGTMQSDQYQAAGKTGTAQYQTGSDRSHTWFVGFAPADDPQIALGIVLENGSDVPGAVSRLAKELFDEYLLRDGE